MKKPTYLTGIGALFLFMGLSISFSDASPAVGAAITSFGLIYVLRGVQVARLGEQALRGDERTRKVGAWAASYSWFMTLLTLNIIFWLDRLELVSVKTGDVLGFLILFMTFSLLFFRLVFSRKGDVN